MAAGQAERKRRRIKKRVVLGEINIVSHPHSPEAYQATFRTLAEKRVAVLYHGHRQIEVGTCRDLDDQRLPGALAGRLFIFSRVNFNDSWINLQKNEEASRSELSEVRIPEHLAPEFRQFRYVFDVNRHRFFFEKFSIQRQHLSARALARALNAMFGHYEVSKNFDEINAFVIPDEEAIENILNTYKLRKLSIHLFRPNPDDEEFEADTLGEMNEQQVGQLETTLIKAPGVKSIIPNTITRKWAWLAAKLGYVEAWGKDENNAPIRKNTQEHPKEHNVVFQQTEDSADKIIDYIKDLKSEGDGKDKDA